MQGFVNYKNIRVHFSSEGKGSVIVLLHGFLEDSSMWKDIVPVLSQTNRVICIDLLGHGKTPCLRYIHTMNDQANMVHAVLKFLKLRKYSIIGHSMGGYIALTYAKHYPKTIKGLCLHNSTFQADSLETQALRVRANKMVQTNFKNMVHMSFTNLFSKESRENFKPQIKAALQIALKTPLQSYIASQEGMRLREDTTSFFTEAPFYKALIIGKKDTVVNVNFLITFSKENNIPTTILPEGHMSHIENIKPLIIALKNFAKNC